MIILGIDPSLTRTGLAVLHDGQITTHSITSKPTGDPTIADRARRIDHIWWGIYKAIPTPLAGAAVIEGPAFSRTTGQQHDRSGLWWHIVRRLHRAGFDVVEIPPNVRAKYATGRGNAGKDEVLAQVIRRYCPNVNLVRNNDEADALVLAAIGARLVGAPVDDPMPKAHLAALAKIPTLEGTSA